jgi:hypothetical protein
MSKPTDREVLKAVVEGTFGCWEETAYPRAIKTVRAHLAGLDVGPAIKGAMGEDGYNFHEELEKLGRQMLEKGLIDEEDAECWD